MPNVTVVRQRNAGKAAALNQGIRVASHELIAMVDADTVFRTDSIRLLVQRLADPAVGAVAGNAKVGNRRKIVAAWQHIEYVIGFNLDRRMYEVLHCMPTVPGAIAAFHSVRRLAPRKPRIYPRPDADGRDVPPWRWHAA